MRLIPKTVATLVTQNSDVARVRDGITSSLQPALNFLNQYFAPMTDGSLQITKPTIIQNNTTINGNLVINGVTTMGAGSAGSVNFNIVGCNGISCNGNVNAAGFVSPTGFKGPLDGGTVSAASGATNTYFQHQRVLYRGGNVDQQNLVQPMPFAGSVIGINAQYQGTTNSQTISIKVQKNNADLWTMANVMSGVSGGALMAKSAAKGTYSFAAQDFLTVLSSFSAGGDIRLQVTLFVEMAA